MARVCAIAKCASPRERRSRNSISESSSSVLQCTPSFSAFAFSAAKNGLFQNRKEVIQCSFFLVVVAVFVAQFRKSLSNVLKLERTKAGARTRGVLRGVWNDREIRSDLCLARSFTKAAAYGGTGNLRHHNYMHITSSLLADRQSKVADRQFDRAVPSSVFGRTAPACYCPSLYTVLGSRLNRTLYTKTVRD